MLFKVLERFIEQQTWLDDLGDPMQKYINSVFSDAGERGRQAKNFLNGTWLGHSLHPAITDVPVGAWVSTLVLDTVASVTGDESMEQAADITLAVGLASAAGAAVTGWTDWSDTYGDDRKLGLLHGMTMGATTLIYAGSLIARRAGARGAGIALSNLGFGFLSTGAYLGGEEVFGLGYGVNRTAFHHPPSEFVPVLPEGDLSLSTPQKVDAKGVPVVLVKQDGQVYALDDTCVHAGCSLAGGRLDGRSIICPCHGSQFDLSDGSVINGPATMPEPSYDVRVQNGMIEVKKS